MMCQQRCIRRCANLGITLIGIAAFLRMSAICLRAAETDSAEKAPASAPIPREANIRDRLEAHCLDGSVLKVYLLDEKIPLKTDYGTLQIPAADIRRIEFATRMPRALTERVNTAVAKLGNDDYHVRESASAELLALQQIAYPALLAACENTDPEVVHRAEQLISQIRKAVSADDLEFQESDIVFTDKSQIAGVIDLQSLRVDCAALGEQQLKFEMLRRIELGGEGQTGAMPDPGNLINYQNQVGKTFYFQLTGYQQNARGGYVWGTDVYTLDSTVWMAAMHAGLLQPGQSKVVGVTILGPQNTYSGSRRNNITSGDWGALPGAFRFKTGRAAAMPAARAQNAPPVVAPQFNPGFFVQPGIAR